MTIHAERKTYSRGKEEENKQLIRRALNYAYWALENQAIVKPAFLEKATKTVFDLLKIVRNSSIELNCLFVYWILHEMMFSGQSIDEKRIQAGIDSVIRVSQHFHIEIPGVVDTIDTVKV